MMGCMAGKSLGKRIFTAPFHPSYRAVLYFINYHKINVKPPQELANLIFKIPAK
jgi:hypothetical protein